MKNKQAVVLFSLCIAACAQAPLAPVAQGTPITSNANAVRYGESISCSTHLFTQHQFDPVKGWIPRELLDVVGPFDVRNVGDRFDFDRAITLSAPDGSQYSFDWQARLTYDAGSTDEYIDDLVFGTFSLVNPFTGEELTDEPEPEGNNYLITNINSDKLLIQLSCFLF